MSDTPEAPEEAPKQRRTFARWEEDHKIMERTMNGLAQLLVYTLVAVFAWVISTLGEDGHPGLAIALCVAFLIMLAATYAQSRWITKRGGYTEIGRLMGLGRAVDEMAKTFRQQRQERSLEREALIARIDRALGGVKLKPPPFEPSPAWWTQTCPDELLMGWINGSHPGITDLERMQIEYALRYRSEHNGARQ